MLSADPRCAELEAWLASLPPRTELTYRLALRGLSEYCRGDRAWRARIDELLRQYGNTTSKLAAVMRDTAAVRGRIMAEVAEQEASMYCHRLIGQRDGLRVSGL
jgi:hypothetical protein